MCGVHTAPLPECRTSPPPPGPRPPALCVIIVQFVSWPNSRMRPDEPNASKWLTKENRRSEGSFRPAELPVARGTVWACMEEKCWFLSTVKDALVVLVLLVVLVVPVDRSASVFQPTQSPGCKLTCCSRSGHSRGACSARHRPPSYPWISVLVLGLRRVLARGSYSLVVARAPVVDEAGGGEESGGSHCEYWD